MKIIHIILTIRVNYIEEQCSLKFPPLIRKKIRSEIYSYIIMNEMQDAAPHKGGSGRANDLTISPNIHP